jgi:hypothetical protein
MFAAMVNFKRAAHHYTPSTSDALNKMLIAANYGKWDVKMDREFLYRTITHPFGVYFPTFKLVQNILGHMSQWTTSGVQRMAPIHAFAIRFDTMCAGYARMAILAKLMENFSSHPAYGWAIASHYDDITKFCAYTNYIKYNWT